MLQPYLAKQIGISPRGVCYDCLNVEAARDGFVCHEEKSKVSSIEHESKRVDGLAQDWYFKGAAEMKVLFHSSGNLLAQESFLLRLCHKGRDLLQGPVCYQVFLVNAWLLKRVF